MASVRATNLPSSPAPALSIVLATLDERRNLPEVIARIQQQALPPFEIIIVDDGSTDGTREYLSELQARDPRVRVLLHEGKQTTLRAQFQAVEVARGPYVIVFDADLQHPPEFMPSFLRSLDSGADLVVGSRYLPGGSAGPRTLYRWAASRGAEFLSKLLLPPARGLTDPVSGYFAFRRDIFRSVNPLYRGYKPILFLLVMAEDRHLTEVAYRFDPRAEGESKIATGFAFIRIFLIELILTRRFRSELRRRPPSAASAALSDPPPVEFSAPTESGPAR